MAAPSLLGGPDAGDSRGHGFCSMGDFVPEGKAAIDEATGALRRALA
jgi:hypothetical protein